MSIIVRTLFGFGVIGNRSWSCTSKHTRTYSFERKPPSFLTKTIRIGLTCILNDIYYVVSNNLYLNNPSMLLRFDGLHKIFNSNQVLELHKMIQLLLLFLSACDVIQLTDVDAMILKPKETDHFILRLVAFCFVCLQILQN